MNNAADTLDIGTMIQPFAAEQIHRDEGYYCRGPHLIRGDDSRYYMVYSRWPKKAYPGGWLTNSEVALAVADSPAGPYTHKVECHVFVRRRQSVHSSHGPD